MAKKAKLKQSIMSWVLTFVMIASVVMVPVGEVKAAEDINLTFTSGVQVGNGENDEYGKGKIDISFGNGGYTTLSALHAAGVTELQVRLKINSVTAISGQTPKIQPFINAADYWKGTQKNLLAGDEEVTYTHDLSKADGSAAIYNFGLQFTNVETINYEIKSVKLIKNPEAANPPIDNTRTESSGVTVSVVEKEKGNGWSSFDFNINNGTGKSICDWIIKMKAPSGKASLFEAWSCVYLIEGDYIYLYPMRNKTNAVVTGTSLTGYIPGGGFSADISASDIVIESVTFNYGSESAIDYSEVGNSNDDNNGGGSEDYNGSLTYELPEDCVDDAETTPFDIHGKLHVDMNSLKIKDKNGNPFQLRGISSHGINWGGDNGEYQNEYINYSSIKKTRDILNANAIRLAMYTDEYNGYTSGGNPSELKYRVDKGVQCAKSLGMYAIVDWHILNSNPKEHIIQAKEFWDYASKRYCEYENVLYEICNEPTSGIWTDIKEYAETIIPIIRENDPDAIIIVGTPTWSQDVDIAMNNPLKDTDGSLMDNVMYTIHFYAATHGETYWNKMKTAWNTIPIFCTEYGMCESSGSGSNDFATASKWLDLMDEHCISYFVWNISETPETSAIMKSGKGAYNTWTVDNLNESGLWIKEQYTARKDVNNIIPDNNLEKPGLVGISLSKDSITLEKGAAAKLGITDTSDITLTAKPEEAELGELTYVSGNSNVAAVSKSGVITAIGKGSTKITIKSGTVVAELTVNVKVTPTGVDLKDAVTLTLGEDENSLSLVAKAYPEDSDNTEIVWNILGNDVINAVVDENESSKLNITALKKGSVTITAKIKDTDINKSCVITVAETVNSIEISDSEITLITKEGSNTKQLTSVTKPTGIDGIAWDSSDPKVAMVDQTGLVTAIGNGTATITASVGAKKDSCQVTVIKLIDKVTITDSTGEQVESLTMTVGDTKILDGAVSPADATGAGIINWVVDKGTDVVSFDSQTGTLKALKEGSASVVITAGENIGQIENTKQNTLNISVNKKQLPDVEKPYVIELNRLPGGKDYTDDTYLNSISGNAEGQTKLADYDKVAGKLTLLGDSDYKLTGNNEEIVINNDKTEGTETEADKPTVVLDNAVVKSIDTVATVKINGITTIKDNVTAKSIVIEGTNSNVNVGGTIKADNIVLNAGTVSVESGIKATDTITIGSNIKLTVRSAKKSDGTLESAIDAPNITVKDGAEIKADEETKTALFSNTPKDETGKVIDVSKYTGSSNSEEGDNEGNNNNDNGSSSGKTENNGGNADNKDNKGPSDNNGSGTTDSDKKTESQQNNSDQTNTNDQQTGQTTGGNSTGVPVVKATDMTLTTDVKAVKGVTISGTYQLAVKKSMVVEAAFTPEDAVKENITLTSSDSKVVTVNGTKLTAKKAGTSRITVTSENGLTKIFKVKVMKKAVSKVKLKASKRSVKIGKSLKLKAATYPSKKAGSKVNWKSSNESIATVTQKGVVKGIKKGKVKITATALDGSGKKKDIKITVR